jgi:hypothetical protein
MRIREKANAPSEAPQSAANEGERMYSTQDIMRRFNVSQGTVLGWIRSGELKAVNASANRGSRRPLWRVPAAALEAFEASRANLPAPEPARRRPEKPGAVIEFYK